RIMTKKGSEWDPEDQVSQRETMSSLTYIRIQRDISALFSDPIPGVVAIPEDEDITSVHALITGPFDTPYEGGFFYFIIRFPGDYPISPPRIKMMTTCNETVRFNPNIYRNGKVCLSILGTWTGPAWSPALTLSSLLISIQSLLNENPFYNEPGYERGSSHSNPKDVSRYNEIIKHETIRVAVCDMLEGTNRDTQKCPQSLKTVMQENFSRFYDHYVGVVKEGLDKLPAGTPMSDPFGEPRGVFSYQSLLVRLEALKEKYCSKS
ncbi:ubiquitin-conjugating enzyme-like protein, partial [Leptotrombidium deliense]